MTKKSIPLFAPAIPAVALCLLACSCSKQDDGGSAMASADEPVQLQLVWAPGETYDWRMDLQQSSEMTFPMRVEPNRQGVTMTQKYRISVPQEQRLNLEYQAAKMEMSVNGKIQFSFDSENRGQDTNSPMAPVFLALIGSEIGMELDAENKVQSVNGLDELLQGIAANAPAQSKSIVTNVYGESVFKQMVELDKGLPRDPVKPGDSWAVQVPTLLGPIGQSRVDMEYTFNKWDTFDGQPAALLDFKGTIASSQNKTKAMMGMVMRLDGGTVNGQIYYDPQRKMPVRTKLTQNLKMVLTAKLPRVSGQGGGSQEIPMDMIQVVTINLVRPTAN